MEEHASDDEHDDHDDHDEHDDGSVKALGNGDASAAEGGPDCD